ncbi:MAG: hypothetical protein DRP87_10015 [Spirochaetes bacterium]|nr:MAG: hypothetical protein DRP87_10015 [Spirochaetota bacterium]
MEKIPVRQRIDNFKKFYKMELEDGPLVGFFLETYFPLKRYRGASTIPDDIISPKDIRVEEFREDYERLFRLHEDTGGDFIWTATPFWGLPWMEAIIGCDVYADHKTGSTRSVPPEDFMDEEDIREFDPKNPWVEKVGEFLSMLTETSHGRYPLGTTLMRGISDLLSALYGNPDFIYKLVEERDRQKEIAKKLTSIWIEFARYQIKRIPEFYGGVGAFFYNLWMPGKGTMLQEDASAMLSPKLFGEVIYPCICDIIKEFDSTVIHLHPSMYIPVEYLENTELSAVELHIDFGGPRAEELCPYYKKIIAKKPLIIWGDIREEDFDFIERNLDREGLALLPVVKGKNEAEDIWKRFKS